MNHEKAFRAISFSFQFKKKKKEKKKETEMELSKTCLKYEETVA